MAEPHLIEMHELTRVYQLGPQEIHALRGVDLVIERGEYVAVMGPSGSGKSTLMNIVGCLDTPTSGRYLLDGVPVESLNDDELAAIRNTKIGFVFQTFNLLARTTALDGRRGTRGSRSRRSDAPSAERALRRPAPACRGRTRAGEQTIPAARRRADRKSRFPD